MRSGKTANGCIFEAMYAFQDQYGHRPVLDKLAEFGMPVHEKNSKNGWTLLHCASYRDDGKHVKIYLDSGADATAVNNDLKTPSQMTSGTISDYIRNYVRTDKPTVNKKEVAEGYSLLRPALSAGDSEWVPFHGG
jgi:ankyrin repeat protein